MSYSDNVSLSYCPNYSQKLKTSFKPKTNHFGDGYKQIVGEGVNQKNREYSLSFSRSSADCDAIEALILSTKQVGKILWTPLNGATGKWIYKDLKRSIDDFGTHTVSLTLIEVFEP